MILFTIPLLFLLFHLHRIIATFNESCTTICAEPGMICDDGRCKCNSNQRLFWTGARCWECPSSWTMSETGCLFLYGQPLNYQRAEGFCRSMQAELLTVENVDLDLIYRVTSNRKRRRRREPQPSIDPRTIAWTSAQATNLNDLGFYEWVDPNVFPFDMNHPSWCKRNTTGLGYAHPFNEPTQLKINGEQETCVIFRRGLQATPMLCLDDVMCSEQHLTICERSEFAAEKYLGTAPPPGAHSGQTVPYGSGVFSTTKSNVVPKTSVGSNAGTPLSIALSLGETKPKTSNNSSRTIVLVILALFLLALIIAALIFFLKCRSSTRSSDRTPAAPKRRLNTPRKSTTSSSDASETMEPSEAPSQVHEMVEEPPVSPPEDVPPTLNQPAKSKRAGFTKQHFDEFE